MAERDLTPTTPPLACSRLTRWLLAGAGVVSVGLAALGAVLPGLPTTVFLIAASWCFARSCPWLEERLVRTRLFRPFLGFLDGGTMPRRAVLVTLAAMWTAVAASTAALLLGSTPRPLVAGVVVAGALVGSVAVVRLGGAQDQPGVRRRQRPPEPTRGSARGLRSGREVGQIRTPATEEAEIWQRRSPGDGCAAQRGASPAAGPPEEVPLAMP